MSLSPGETIVTAWAETCSGPGWSNALIWVLISTPTGLRVESIQPHEQTAEMRAMHSVGATVTREMRKMVEGMADRRGVGTEVICG